MVLAAAHLGALPQEMAPSPLRKNQKPRGGNVHTARGAASFLTKVFRRVRAAGATGPMVMRADSGFYNRKVTAACDKEGVAYSITAKMSKSLLAKIAAIDEEVTA